MTGLSYFLQLRSVHCYLREYYPKIKYWYRDLAATINSLPTGGKHGRSGRHPGNGEVSGFVVTVNSPSGLGYSIDGRLLPHPSLTISNQRIYFRRLRGLLSVNFMYRRYAIRRKLA